MKQLLIVLNRPPYRGSHSIELLEAAMVGAVFEWQVSLLARDEGVWSYVRAQAADALGRRTVSKVLQALPTYDVDRIYACAPSLAHYGIRDDQLLDGVTTLSLEAQSTLIKNAGCVMGAGL